MRFARDAAVQGGPGPRCELFPSFFSERSLVDRSTISSRACGQRIVAVANLDEPARRISVTSSQGPTRDGRQKPDVAASGTAIVAAKGFVGTDEWIAMSGHEHGQPACRRRDRSDAGRNPQLTGAQITGISSARRGRCPAPTSPGATTPAPGMIDPDACIAEATAMLARRDVT